MIIYFADRNLNITGQASTSLPGGFRIMEDLLTEEVDSGVNVFTCKISYNASNRHEVESAVKVVTFLLKSAGTAFTDKENTYDSLYQIVETEFDTLSQELSVYAEDAGLDLLNRVVGETTFSGKTLQQMLNSTKPGDWSLNLIGCPTGTKTITFDGDATATERINSIVNLFSCEAYYSFVIERFKITTKVINVVPKRGNQTAVHQLRLNKDIDRIVTKTSIADLATALVVTGGTPDGSDTPINLKNYTYSYTDPATGDVYTVDKSSGQMRNTSAMKRWASVLDTDGFIFQQYSYDTTNKATLAGQARAELQKLSKAAIEYEVDFVRLPEDVRIGDRINITDEQGELYLEARLLKIETSVTAMSRKAVVGEYLLKKSGISDAVAALAREYAANVKNGLSAVTISVLSSGGNVFHNTPIATTLSATVFYGEIAISTQAALEEVFGVGSRINWYDGEGTLVGAGFTYSVESSQTSEKYTVRLEV